MFNNMTIKQKSIYALVAMGIGIAVMLVVSLSSMSKLEKSSSDMKEVGIEMAKNQKIIAEHEHLMGEIYRSTIKNIPSNLEDDHKACGLGEWYYSFKATSEFKNLPKEMQDKFIAMEPHHEKLHAAVKEYQEKYIFYDKYLNDSMMQRELSHMNFSAMIVDSIINHQVTNVPTDADTCSFGVWLNEFLKSKEFESLQDDVKESFEDIVEPHRRLHETGIKIKELQRAGKFDEAMDYYNKHTLKHLKKVKEIISDITFVFMENELDNKPIRDNMVNQVPLEFAKVIAVLKEYDAYLENLEHKIVDENAELVTFINVELTIVAVILLVVFIVLISVVFGAIKSIVNFKDGLMNFFRYLNQESDHVEKIKNNSNDEIGVMVKVVNENISKTKETIEKDAVLISEAKDVINKVKNGSYSKEIRSSTTNNSLEDLKNSVNEMIRSMKDTYGVINTQLSHYSKYDYSNHLEIKNAEKDSELKKAIESINELRNSIVSSLENSLNTSDELLTKANNLQIEAKILSESTKQQSSNLDKTSGSMEQITSSIEATSEKIKEVVSQSEDIKSVVTIISDIAEQTNLLALNAAIEAARAGENGRGFAVVADEVRKLAERTQKSLLEINTNINILTQSITDIGQSAEEQTKAIEHINSAILEIDISTKENSKVANDVNSVANTVKDMASKSLDEIRKNKF